MSRISDLQKLSGKKLVIYLMSGDPDLKTTEMLVEMLCEEGVSLIELGVPFSDPIADGKTIQQAGERALKTGSNIASTLEIVKKIRKKYSTPIVFMTYYNLIYHYGVDKFIGDAVKAGVDGAILPDLPFDEDKVIRAAAKAADFDLIYLAAPTNTLQRSKKIVENTRGFLYYILLKGTTGARKGLSGEYKKAAALRKMGHKQVFAGFGVSKPEQAKEALKYADGVIVGSAFVNIIAGNAGNKKILISKARSFVKKFVAEVKKFESPQSF